MIALCVVLDRLTTSNQVLLVLGVMLLCGGVVVLIILTVLKVTEKGVISKYNSLIPRLSN